MIDLAINGVQQESLACGASSEYLNGISAARQVVRSVAGVDIGKTFGDLIGGESERI
jgi:hypothetical protein